MPLPTSIFVPGNPSCGERKPIPRWELLGLYGGLAWGSLLPPRTWPSGLHPPASAPHHSQLPGHHSWVLKAKSLATLSDSSVRKDASGVGGVLLLPSLDLGVAALLRFAAVFWSLDGLKQSSQLTLRANPHFSSSQVLFCLCLDLGL